jgi:hypothetical protein
MKGKTELDAEEFAVVAAEVEARKCNADGYCEVEYDVDIIEFVPNTKEEFGVVALDDEEFDTKESDKKKPKVTASRKARAESLENPHSSTIEFAKLPKKDPKESVPHTSPSAVTPNIPNLLDNQNVRS